MAYNFVAEQNRLIMIISQASVAEQLSCVFSAEENLGGHRIKDDAVETEWLITHDTD
jgi:hypothetical protein